MKIALLGYGKMGKEIESVLTLQGEHNHEIVFIADENNGDFKTAELSVSDVAIEFSTPGTVINNIYKCFEAKVPVVVGTTGWYQRLDEVEKKCRDLNQSLFYATNFSIGVNIFFELNKNLARIMRLHPNYNIEMEEIHHAQKTDAPSGTALTLANDIISISEMKKKWISVLGDEKNQVPKKNGKNSPDLEILSVRKNNIPGTHIIKYDSEIDSIEIKHTAKNRRGFALGAVAAAEFLIGKKGVFGMKDFLAF